MRRPEPAHCTMTAERRDSARSKHADGWKLQVKRGYDQREPIQVDRCDRHTNLNPFAATIQTGVDSSAGYIESSCENTLADCSPENPGQFREWNIAVYIGNAFN